MAADAGRPLALFAPRRVGKTYFLDHDLTPAARQGKMLPVYADLWLHKADPLGAINHALEEALDDATVPEGAVGKIAKTPVKKINVLGTGVDLGEAPQRRPLPAAPELRLDALIARLASRRGGKILLMLDEVQTLADFPPALIATLRAVLHKRKDQVDAVFTGSSQEGLAKLMTTVGAPMYQFAQLLTFPFLGDEYLQQLAGHFAKVHPGKALDLGELRQLFVRLGHKPALLRDIVKSMSAEGITDTEIGLRHFMSDERQVTGWRALLDSLEALDRLVLTVIGQGLPPLGQGTLDLLGKSVGGKVTISKVRASIDKLKRLGILSKWGGKGGIEDQLLAEYVANLPLGPALSRTLPQQGNKKANR
ncbi:MAG: hypothetical protein FWF17_01135 [Betaproteobacteria bacterium]|nr:hypothetical protein [Betaproteobacteria bacterium]